MTQPVAATRVASFMLSWRNSILVEREQGAALGFDPFVAAGDDAEAVDYVRIGTEVGDAIGDIKVESRNDTHDRDESEDGEDYAE